MSDSPKESAFSFKTHNFDGLTVGTGAPMAGIDHPPPVSGRSELSNLTGASTVFETAASSFSVGSGGGALNVNKIVEIKHIDDSSLLCCAVIPKSGGRRVCTKTKGKCGKTHDETVELRNNTLYVVPRANQVLVTHSLAKHCLTIEEFEEAMQTKQAIAVWGTFFDSRKVEEEESASWEEVDAPPTPHTTLADVVKGHEDLKSPKATRLSDVLGDLKEDDVPLDELLEKPTKVAKLAGSLVHPADVPGDFNETVATLVSDWKTVQENFDVLSRQQNISQENLMEIRQSLGKVVEITDEKFKKLDTKAKVLMELLGSHDKASDSGEKSIWAAIGDLRREHDLLCSDVELHTHRLGLHDVKHEQASEGKDAVHKKFEELDVFLSQLKGTCEAEFGKVFVTMRQLVTLVNDVKTAREQVRAPPLDAKQANLLAELESMVKGFGDEDPVKKLKELNMKVNYLEAGMASIIANKSSTPTSTDGTAARAQSWEGGYGDLNSIFYKHGDNAAAMRDRVPNSAQTSKETPMGRDQSVEIQKMKENIEELQRQSKGTGYSNREFHIPAYADAVDFVTRTNSQSGHNWDIYSAFVAMCSKRVEPKEHADFGYAAHRAATTRLGSMLEASMTSGKPAIFFGETNGRPRPASEGMANCKTWEQWAEGMEPFEDTITFELNNFVEGVEGNLPPLSSIDRNDVNLRNERDAVSMSYLLLSAVKEQWKALQGFITSQYKQLTGQSKFKPESAWLLVGRYVSAIFTHMIQFRNPSRALQDSNTIRSRATLFWSVLQCHRAMQEFIDKKFVGHPVLVKELSMFSLMDRVSAEELIVHKRSTNEEFDRSKKRIKVLEETNKKLESDIKDLRVELRALANTHKQFVAKVNAKL